MLKPHRDDNDVTPDNRVASLLQAAAAPTEPGPVPGEAEALAAFRRSRVEAAQLQLPRRRSTLATAVLAAVGAGILITGGVAAAAGGKLPGAAQDTARDVLDVVGFEVPGADNPVDDRSRRGSPDGAAATDRENAESRVGSSGEGSASDPEALADTEGAGKGAEVSEHARSRDPRDRRFHRRGNGVEVSRSASDGRSHAGERGRHERPRSRHQAERERDSAERWWDRERAWDRQRSDAGQKGYAEPDGSGEDDETGWEERRASEQERGELEQSDARTRRQETEGSERAERPSTMSWRGSGVREYSGHGIQPRVEDAPRDGEASRDGKAPREEEGGAGGGTAGGTEGTAGSAEEDTGEEGADSEGESAGGEEGADSTNSRTSGRGAGGGVNRR